MPSVFSANRSSILVDGGPVEGLQSITFRVVTEREDVRAIGQPPLRTRLSLATSSARPATLTQQATMELVRATAQARLSAT